MSNLLDNMTPEERNSALSGQVVEKGKKSLNTPSIPSKHIALYNSLNNSRKGHRYIIYYMISGNFHSGVVYGSDELLKTLLALIHQKVANFTVHIIGKNYSEGEEND